MIITLASFWPVTRAQFINYDDNEYVTNNPMVLQGLRWQGIKWAFTTRHASNWHPLTWLSHMLDASMFGRDARGPHIVNLGLHALNALLFFWVLMEMTAGKALNSTPQTSENLQISSSKAESMSGVGCRVPNRELKHWSCAFLAGLFALHPLHVESVAWVAERKDVLSGLFFFLTIFAYVNYVRRKFETRKETTWYVFALVAFALGLMSKPMLVTLPFVLLLLDYWPLQRFQPIVNYQAATRSKTDRLSKPPIHRLFVEKLPFFALSAAACAATVWAQEKAIQPLEHLRLGDRLQNAGLAYALYVLKTFWPAKLTLPYLHPGQWPWSQVVGAFAFIVIVSGLALCLRKERPYLLVGWLWFLGMLVPVIGLVQVGTQAMADRYTYLPLLGLFFMVVWWLADLCANWKMPGWAIGSVGSVILLACVCLTFRQATYWKDSETLFKHADAVTKDNFIAVANVGGVFFESGRLGEAMEWYQRSYQMNPRYPEAVNSIGAVLAAQGKDEAIEWFQKALVIQPSHLEALYNMGNEMVKKGRNEEAVSYYEAAVRAKPDNHEARNNLGNALMKLRRFDEAVEQYREAVRYQPGEALILKNLGEAMAAKGRLDEAISQYRNALALTNDPGTHYSLGLTLAVQAKWDAAIEQFTETLRLSPTNAEVHYNLGYANLMAGKFSDAEQHLKEALRRRPIFPLAHFNLGCVLDRQGRHAEARLEWKQALQEKPDYEEAKRKLDSSD